MSFKGFDFIKERIVPIRNEMRTVLFDIMWRSNSPAWIAAYGFGKLDVVSRETAYANWLVLKGDIGGGGDRLSRVIAKYPQAKAPIQSLGGLLSQVGLEDPSVVWSRLKPIWLEIDKPEKINEKNHAFFFLGVELGLICEPSLAESAINNIYFPFIWHHERIDKKERDPVLYWHVPKTGGTSMNATLSKGWYKSGTRYLPSYTTRHFFSYVVRCQDGVLPYLSSAHLSALDIGVGCLGAYRKIIVLRDPEKRALSAWRQYRENPVSRLNILPQHGAVWRFFPVCSLGEWVVRAPRHVVNPLEWTFAGFGDDIDSGVDDVVALEDLVVGGRKLAQEMGLHLKDASFSTEKNVTNKKIRPAESDMAHLINACRPDAKIYRHLHTKTS